MGADDLNLVWSLAVALTVSYLMALLILRSVFRREGLAKLATPAAVIVLPPYAGLLLGAIFYAAAPASSFDHWYMLVASVLASAAMVPVFWLVHSIRRPSEMAALALVVAYGFVAGHGGGVSAERVGYHFFWAIPVVMLASFLVALLVLRSMFRNEGWAKALFAAMLVAQFACTLPPFQASMNDTPLAAAGRWYLWYMAVKTLFLAVFFFLPAVLLLALWLIAFVRHSLLGERSYGWEAAAALLLGACTVWYAAYAMWWATFDKL